MQKVEPYKITDGVTQSLMSTFTSCRQRCRYVLDGWEFPRSKSALIFGSYFHWLIEHHLTAVQAGKKLPSYQQLEEEWSKKNTPNDSDNPEMREQHMGMAFALWDNYCKTWKHSDQKQKEWVGQEENFDENFEGFRIRGRRDGLFRRKGKLWLFETKTASRIDESTLEEKLGFDFQNLFYLIATEIETGEKLAGIEYNIIRKPQIRIKKTETTNEFNIRMQEDVASRPEFYFYRASVTITEKRKRIFKKELRDKLITFSRWLSGEYPTYRNETACTGMWNCEFLSACSKLSLRGFMQTRKLFRELEDE